MKGRGGRWGGVGLAGGAGSRVAYKTGGLLAQPAAHQSQSSTAVAAVLGHPLIDSYQFNAPPLSIAPQFTAQVVSDTKQTPQRASRNSPEKQLEGRPGERRRETELGGKVRRLEVCGLGRILGHNPSAIMLSPDTRSQRPPPLKTT